MSVSQPRVNSQQPKQTQNGSEGPKLDFAKRFLKVFSSHIFGAARQASLPKEAKGIIFYSTEATKFDKDGLPFRYRPAHLGRAVVLTPEQAAFISKYLGITEDPFGVRK